MDYDENIYRINLKSALTASDLVYGLSAYLDNEEVRNKKIFLQMSDIDLSVAQIKSIRSLINSVNSSLSFISTNSDVTKASAMALEIVISDEDTNLNIKLEPEKTYKTVEEVIEEKSEIVEEKPVISIETPEFTTETAQSALESIFDEPKEEAETEEINETAETVRNTEKTEVTETLEPVQTEISFVEAVEEPQAVQTESVSQEVSSSGMEEKEKTNIEATEQEIQDSLDSIFESDKKITDILNIQEPEEGLAPDIEYYKNLDNEFTQEDLEIENLSTMYLKHTLRSGQVINYEGNVVIIGDCHTGSEVHATGDITVWGILNGIAHAGSMGNTRAKIRALKMNAIQLRIADSYARKPDALNSVLVEKTNVFTPEEARYIDGDIIIFKIND